MFNVTRSPWWTWKTSGPDLSLPPLIVRSKTSARTDGVPTSALRAPAGTPAEAPCAKASAPNTISETTTKATGFSITRIFSDGAQKRGLRRHRRRSPQPKTMRQSPDRPPWLVLLTRRCGAVLERPHPVFELQHQQTVVLARGPQRPLPAVILRDPQVHLRRAPVRTARNEVTRENIIVVRPGAECRLAGRVVVGDLFRMMRIAYVEYADARIEVAAGQRRCAVLVVHAAVVTAVREGRQAHQIRQHLAAVSGVVHLQRQPRHDLRLSLIANVDDPRQRERR